MLKDALVANILHTDLFSEIIIKIPNYQTKFHSIPLIIKLPLNNPQISISLSQKKEVNLSSCRKIIKEDESKMNEEGKKNNSERLTRKMILDINVSGKLAVAIVEASSVFKTTLKQIVNISFLIF